ncbi:HAD-IIIA family hydrolase [Nocardioides sp. TF02-7]|uniref:HAD-IIIA family hydrolase n=1 Tax=Nocardioides sp. TF02-7 TaxID=2917724 RepID=UPI001F05E846|nr:HAD-IIIA family hydrolase [Nocardioides sp. TF02-7]UMG93655.1 HAD-IIIA family hydrolase [Nocardioides sp. TF02-7]
MVLEVLRSGGGGPARARNVGWRHARTRWVAFLDDDVLPESDWYQLLLTDLTIAESEGQVGSQGRIVVPLPADRRPTDDERVTIGLVGAAWITADMAYRRDALAAVGGFDERFTRAFREDSDIALRLGADRGTVRTGVRQTAHPLRPDPGTWSSVRQQAGNADDRLMRRLHGPDWRARARAPLGRLPRHALVTAAGLAGLGGVLARRPALAGAGVAGWLLGTGELAWARIAPGPRTAREVRRMVVTSAAIPPVAVWHSLRGLVRHRTAGPWRGLPDAVLFDRDGTLVHDVPYNGDPALVRPTEHARDVLDRLRAAGVRVGVVTNQSAIGTGRLEPEQVAAVNRRVEELLGPFDGIYVCPHAPDAGCACRKPAPGLVK